MFLILHLSFMVDNSNNKRYMGGKSDHFLSSFQRKERAFNDMIEKSNWYAIDRSGAERVSLTLSCCGG